MKNYFEVLLAKPVNQLPATNSWSGVRGKWFWAVEAFMGTPNSTPPPAPQPDDSLDTGDAASADAQVQDLLVENPLMSAPTLVNAMKSKGLQVIDTKSAIKSNGPDAEETNEADTLSTGNALTRAAPPKQKQASIKDHFVRCRFLESKTTRDGIGPTVFKVALIQEGLGNIRDAFYYTRDCLESAITQFEGKKCYADHPSRSDEVDRPERSVRDIVGYFQGVNVQESADGTAMLIADLVMLPDPSFEWARALVRESVDYGAKYPDKEFIGLSINASGDAVEMPIQDFLKQANIPESAKPKLMDAINQGLSQVRVVSAIQDAVSTDLVTEPGAKGKVLEMLEGETKKGNEMSKKKIKLFESDEDQNPPAAGAPPAPAAKKKGPPIPPKKEDASDPEAGEVPGQDDHADADQDKALILNMIKKHMDDQGDDSAGDDAKADPEEGKHESEESHQEDGMMMSKEADEAAHQAYEGYKEMGYEHEAAIKCAAHAMKLAHHMAMKQKKEAGAKESDDNLVPPNSGNKKSPAQMPAGGSKEAEARNIKLEGRIAMLERELNERKLADTLDKKLKESGLARAETDKIRTLIVNPKSEKEIVEKINLFKEGMQLAGSKTGVPNPFVTSTEKATSTGSKGSFDFKSALK